jgi:hypothetical protein
MRTVCLGVLLALVAPRAARADGGGDYVRLPPPHDILITTPGQRSTKNIAILSALAGAALVFGGIGLYENLDSKSAADKVSASSATGIAWNSTLQDDYDRAHRSGVAAGVCYGIGGALLVGAAAYLIATVPASETTVIHPHAGGPPTRTLAHGPRGAVLGGVWRW